MALGQRSQALLTMLYRSTDRLCRCGAPMKNLAHSASFESLDKDAPSKARTKHLGRGNLGGGPGFQGWILTTKEIPLIGKRQTVRVASEIASKNSPILVPRARPGLDHSFVALRYAMRCSYPNLSFILNGNYAPKRQFARRSLLRRRQSWLSFDLRDRRAQHLEPGAAADRFRCENLPIAAGAAAARE